MGTLKNYLTMPVFSITVGVIAATALSFGLMKGCAQPPASPAPAPAQSSSGEAVAACGGAIRGDTRNGTCQAGQIGNTVEICTDEGWATLDSNCQASNPVPGPGGGNGGGGAGCEETSVVSFEQVKPILEQKCMSCHASDRYTDFAVAKALMAPPAYEMLSRLNRNDLGKMPPNPQPALPAAEVKVFQDWLEDGLLEKNGCVGDPTNGEASLNPVDLDYVEEKISNYVRTLRTDKERENTRFLILGHKYNEQLDAKSMDLMQKAIAKNLNGISTEEQLSLPTPIDAKGTIFRINLEDYNLQKDVRFGVSAQGQPRDGWELVSSNDEFRFESFTTQGQILKQLLKTNFPWLHADNFSSITSFSNSVYYTIMGVPTTREAFFQEIGVDFQEKFDDFEIKLIGGNASPISLQKNRLISRTECDRSRLCGDGGYFWFTFDPDDVKNNVKQNLFNFPLLPEARTTRDFQFAAQEGIWRLPNGMQGYMLVNAAGERQEAAPQNIVIDVEAAALGFSSEIRNPGSCERCHSKGLINMTDQVRASVAANATEFSREDIDKVNEYYATPGETNALFLRDKNAYAATLQKLGISTADPDPINFALDDFRADWTLEQFCGFILKELNDCRQLIDSSAIVKAEIGNLLTEGGLVSVEQVKATFPKVKQEFRLGQDPIN